jgi:hypothetical protein
LEKIFEKSVSNPLVKLENEFQSLRKTLSFECTSARFLWTTGQLKGGVGGGGGGDQISSSNSNSCWIPWDTQIMNVVPNIILWEKNSPEITIRVPGLYR